MYFKTIVIFVAVFATLVMSPRGNVNSLTPEEFIDAYNQAGPNEKYELTQEIKRNTGRLISDNNTGQHNSTVSKVLKLIQLEEVKWHVGTINTMHHMENPTNMNTTSGGNGSGLTATEYLEQLDIILTSRKSDVKLSVSKVSRALRGTKKKTQDHISRPDVSRLVNFLKKTVYQGIIENDPTSLARIGSLVDLETFQDKVTRKPYSADSVRLGKAAKKATKWTGIIGALDDVGLNIFYLLDNQHDTTKSSKDDPFEALEQFAMSIVMKAAASVLPIVFPPLAPIISCMGLENEVLSKIDINMLKSGNEVADINYKTPLLESDKRRLPSTSDFELIRSNKFDFTEYLNQKVETDFLPVQHNREFLEKNTEYIGIVFPSLEPDGLAKPNPDSWVDFRKRQRVYLERSIPNDVGNVEFLCKPGSLFIADIQPSDSEYLCENAIGIKLHTDNDKSDQAILIDLADGDDRVYLNVDQKYSSVFKMGENGFKVFYGGGPRTKFLFDSHCEGSLLASIYGTNTSTDRIVIGDQCAKNQAIYVNFCFEIMYTVKENLKVSFYSVEEFVGRKDQPDIVHVACSTRMVWGLGGTSTQMDEVIIPTNTTCEYNIDITCSKFTSIISSAILGNINILVYGVWNGSIDLKIRPTLTQKIIFLSTPSSSISGWFMKKRGNEISVSLEDSQNRMEISFTLESVNDANIIYFNEDANSTANSVLHLTNEGEGSAAVFHLLPNEAFGIREGCKLIENKFEINGDFWYVEGGEKSDEFILNANHILRIDGGEGIDRLKMHPGIKQTVSLLEGKLMNVEIVQGTPGVPLMLQASCNLSFVNTQGGSATDGDYVLIAGDHNCDSMNLTVVAVGNTMVNVKHGNNSSARNDAIHVIVNGTEQANLNFILQSDSLETSNILVTLLLSHTNWTVVAAKFYETESEIVVILKGVNVQNGRNDAINFILKVDPGAKEIYLKSPHIQVAVGKSQTDMRGTMYFDRKSGRPEVVYLLNTVHSPWVIFARGLDGIENIFIMIASSENWNITGGNLNDTFVVETANKFGQHSIHGGGGEGNTLVIQDGEYGPMYSFLVNLVTGRFGKYLSPPDKMSRISNIHHVIGRINAQDIINPSCDTQTVNGRGGFGKGHVSDRIYIDVSGCVPNMFIDVGKFTTVINKSPTGNFSYRIADLFTTSIDIQPAKENLHVVRFEVYPWDYVTAVRIDLSSPTLALKLSDDSHEKTHIFPLWKLPEAVEYSNPVFVFLPNESSVSCNIHVQPDGITKSICHVQAIDNPTEVFGIPVDINQFIVNITNATNGPSGKIEGRSNGQRRMSNQFWIHDLKSGLNIIDGGESEFAACTNSLHFVKSLERLPLNIDMDIGKGSVKRHDGGVLTSQLKNIHELHGTRGITAYASCDTTWVSNVDLVVIQTTSSCTLDLTIVLAEFTTVDFLEPTSTITTQRHFVFDITSLGTVVYRFSNPMSFEVKGTDDGIANFNHIFHLPFPLNSLNFLHFVRAGKTILYSLNGEYYEIPMITRAIHHDEYYAQPSLITEDGYKIQINRFGAIIATLGNSNVSEKISSKSVPSLQATANKLSISIVIKKASEFFYIGHSKNVQDRNMLEQHSAHVTCHLAGGGAADTAYMISHLKRDVYIHTGYDEGSFDNWIATGYGQKQTINLTSIVRRLRKKSRSKYVPVVEEDKGNLIISMAGYKKAHPGRVIVVNGIYPWVVNRIRVLFNTVPLQMIRTNGKSKSNNILSGKQKRSVENSKNQWMVRPEPVVIPENVTIYSISPEDFEDGQEILLAQANTKATQKPLGNFVVAKIGTELYMSNIHNLNEIIKTVVIGNFYGPSSENKNKLDTTDIPTRIQGLTVNLPGLILAIDGDKIMNLSGHLQSTGKTALKPAVVLDWKQILIDVEHTLLDDMPHISRMFIHDDTQPFLNSETISWIFVCLLAALILVIPVCICYMCCKGNTIKREENPVPIFNRRNSDPVVERVEGEVLLLAHRKFPEPAVFCSPNQSAKHSTDISNIMDENNESESADEDSLPCVTRL